MTTHRQHKQKSEIYFITFTCYKWIPLFKIVNLYPYFNNWFKYLQGQNTDLLSYVIMPNHFHGLIFLKEESTKTLNQLVANGKRFLAYEIVKRLNETKNKEIIKRLREGVSEKELEKGKKHQVFQPSFDAKACLDREMVETKLEYIHHNPTQGKWQLAKDWTHYKYSSSSFYMNDEPNDFLTHYKDIV